eukprot:scaffold59948_cov60-Phaeocystis_antarctica.AAC.6
MNRTVGESTWHGDAQHALLRPIARHAFPFAPDQVGNSVVVSNSATCSSKQSTYRWLGDHTVCCTIAVMPPRSHRGRCRARRPTTA